jgi:hypothetical protein
MTVPALSVFVQGQGTVSGDQLNTFLQGGAVASQLRQLTGLPGMTIMLGGITTIDDGSGGFFYWNALGNEPDDNLNFITPVGTFTGQWTRMALDITTGSGNFSSDVSVGGYLTTSYAGGLTALGGGQAGAYVIATSISVFTTVAASTGALLPALIKSGAAIPAGTPVKIFNRGANTLSVYPPNGQRIEGLVANSPSGIGANGVAIFTSNGAGQWYVS